MLTLENIGLKDLHEQRDGIGDVLKRVWGVSA